MPNNIGMKTLLQEDLPKPDFYSDFVYKFREFVGKIDFFFGTI